MIAPIPAWLLAPLAYAEPPTGAVQRAVATGCTRSALQALRGASVDEVVSALRELVGQTRRQATPGLHEHGIGRFMGQEATYELVLPEGEGPFPVLVLPAHPTWAPRSRLAPEGSAASAVATLVINTFNLAYAALPERWYFRLAGRETTTARFVRLSRAAIADALARYPLDPDRLVCAGSSASGSACWTLAEAMPDRWAGVWAISAGWAPRDRASFGNFALVPFRIQHGDADSLVPDAWPLAAIDALREVGNPPSVVWVRDGAHGVNGADLREAGLAWALQQRRAPLPEALRLGLRSTSNPDFWWLHVEDTGRTRGELSPIEARWTDAGVSLTTPPGARVRVRWLSGEGPARGRPGAPLSVRINGREQQVLLAEDPRLPVRAYCETGDLTRLWSGEVAVGG